MRYDLSELPGWLPESSGVPCERCLRGIRFTSHMLRTSVIPPGATAVNGVCHPAGRCSWQVGRSFELVFDFHPDAIASGP